MNIFDKGLLGLLTNNGSEENLVLLVIMVLASAVISYLFGSLSSAIIVSKALYKEDIRTHGSGNAGLTNMLRTYGKKAGLLTLLGDMLKTAIAIFLTACLLGFEYKNGISLSGYCYLSGLCAVLGHVFPIFYGFKGGKGVLVTATMALVLSPACFAILFTLFLVILAISRYVSLGSIVVASLFPVTIALYTIFICNATLSVLTIISTLFLGGFIVWCHRSNIGRLLAGNEKKFSIGKKESK